MALTKVRGAGIDADGQEVILDADGDTTITTDTDDRVDVKVGGSDKVHITSTGLGIGTSSPSRTLHVNSGSTNTGAEFQSTDATSSIKFTDDTGTAEIGNTGDALVFFPAGFENLRLTNSVTGSGFTADSGTSIISHPIHAIRASGLSRTDSYYDFTVDSNGGLYIICGFCHDHQPSTYGKWANFQVAHTSTYVTVNTLNAYGGNGQIGISKPSNTVLRVTFNKNESSGSGSYGTIEFVAVFGANPF